MSEAKDFNEWFKTWHKAEAYNSYSQSQGTGLKRAHSLMTQASKDYEKYLTRTKKNSIIKPKTKQS